MHKRATNRQRRIACAGRFLCRGPVSGPDRSADSGDLQACVSCASSTQVAPASSAQGRPSPHLTNRLYILYRSGPAGLESFFGFFSFACELRAPGRLETCTLVAGPRIAKSPKGEQTNPPGTEATCLYFACGLPQPNVAREVSTLARNCVVLAQELHVAKLLASCVPESCIEVACELIAATAALELRSNC